MIWEYRIVRDAEGGHRIAEVYTDLPHVPGGTSWTSDPIAPYGEGLPELRRDMVRMLKAFRLPVLDEAKLRETVGRQIAR